jgi:hypothetical protein
MSTSAFRAAAGTFSAVVAIWLSPSTRTTLKPCGEGCPFASGGTRCAAGGVEAVCALARATVSAAHAANTMANVRT